MSTHHNLAVGVAVVGIAVGSAVAAGAAPGAAPGAGPGAGPGAAPGAAPSAGPGAGPGAGGVGWLGAAGAGAAGPEGGSDERGSIFLQTPQSAPGGERRLCKWLPLDSRVGTPQQPPGNLRKKRDSLLGLAGWLV